MKKILAFLSAKKYWLIAGVIIVSLIWYWQSRQNQTEVTLTQTPIKQDLTQTLELTGQVDARQIANLRFSTPGRLAWVGVSEGQTVKKWQAIASLDTRTLQKQLQQDLNNFNKAFRTHDQVLDNNNYYGNPDIDKELRRILDNANYDLNNAVIGVEIRDLAIKLSSLVSPFEGVVVKLDQPNPGVNISVTDTFQIINPQSVYFVAQVDELDLKNISIGQKAKIVLDAYENEVIESSIESIGFTPVAGTGGGTSYKVELGLHHANTDFKYRLGMSGDAQIILAQKQNVLTIPAQSLIERDGQFFVDLKVGEETERKQIEIGLETEDYVEVKSGLSDSDQVIVP